MFRGRRRGRTVPDLNADRSGGWCAGRPGGRGGRIRNELNPIRVESGVALGSRQRGSVVEDGGFRPGDLADPALRFRLVGMLVCEHPDRNREQQGEYSGRRQESGREADVLHCGI